MPYIKQANIAHGHQQVNNGSFQNSTRTRAGAKGGHRARLRELSKTLNAELAEMRRINNMARG